MKTYISALKIFCFILLVFSGNMLSGQIRKEIYVSIQPVQGVKDAFLLLCSAEEHSAKRSASSVFTTRLPTLPLRIGKWEESIFIRTGRKGPMNKVRLIDDITFTYPRASISRKALLTPDPEEPGTYILKLFWYEGKMNRFSEITFFRIWSIVSLKPGRPEKIGSMEIKE